MRLIFQNPLWLLGALIAVPLLAHLFSRTRPRRREFPSLRLLREAMRRVTRIRQPRDRWLLLLRTLAMIALVLAFLQPWLMSQFALGSGAAKTAVIVVDVSASMAFADGTRTRVAQATAAAEEVLATLPANSRANVVWIQAHASSALPEPGPNLDFLRQSLQRAVARAEPGDIAGAVALAVKQLAAAGGERELVVISDFQQSAWRDAKPQVPEGIALTSIPIGTEEAANLALAGLEIEPARPVVGQETRLVCRVRNFSPEPHRATVFAEAGESRLSQAVEVAPWSETLAIMPVTFPQEGLVPLKATLSEDRFPGDDVRYGLADVRGALRVGVGGTDEDVTARTWTRAAQALDAVAVRRVPLAELERAGEFDVLFVAGWKGEAAEALSRQLRQGALVLQPGEELDTAALRKLLSNAADQPAGQPLGAEVRDAPGWGLRIADEEHPVFALFAGGAYGDPANARFRRRLATPEFAAGKPLLTFDDGRPALTILDGAPAAVGAPLKTPLSTRNAPPMAWWNLDLAATDWPTRSAFLPFFGEFLRHLASRAGGRALRTFEPGAPLRLELGAALDPADVQLVNERDEAVRVVAESPRTPDRLVSEAPPAPGSYRWMAQNGVLDRAVINFPETESDLRRPPRAELEQNAGTVLASSARLADLREGKPLWPWCLAAAALFLLLEGVCLWRFPMNAERATVAPIVAKKHDKELAAV